MKDNKPKIQIIVKDNQTLNRSKSLKRRIKIQKLKNNTRFTRESIRIRIKGKFRNLKLRIRV